MINSSNKNNKGFTIIETLVAISILLIALAGPLTIAAKGLYSSYYSRDQVTAFYLAQEGIEYFRNLRDTNSLSGQPWNSHFSDCAGTCRVNVTSNVPSVAIASCSGDSHSPGLTCEPLKLDSTSANPSYVYQYTVGNNTNFTREITIKAVANGATPSEEYQISSTVYWVSPLPNHSITLSEDITKWQN